LFSKLIIVPLISFALVVESMDMSRLGVQIWCTRRKARRRRTTRIERQRELTLLGKTIHIFQLLLKGG